MGRTEALDFRRVFFRAKPPDQRCEAVHRMQRQQPVAEISKGVIVLRSERIFRSVNEERPGLAGERAPQLRRLADHPRPLAPRP